MGTATFAYAMPGASMKPAFCSKRPPNQSSAPEALIQAQPQSLPGSFLRLRIALLHDRFHQLDEHITDLVEPKLIHSLYRQKHNHISTLWAHILIPTSWWRTYQREWRSLCTVTCIHQASEHMSPQLHMNRQLVALLSTHETKLRTGKLAALRHFHVSRTNMFS